MKSPFSKPFPFSYSPIFSKYAPWVGHIGLFIILWLVLKPIADKKLSPYPPEQWHSVIWADKSGYYLYLPATFIYHWEGSEMATDLPNKAGHGFSIDSGTSVIRTKYPVGVAYFEAPFFLYTHYIQNGGKAVFSGLESEYQQAVARAGLFWGILGVALLAVALARLSSSFAVGWFCALSVFFGSNLFYYVVLQPGFSHPYSFLLFSGLLLTVPWQIPQPKPQHLIWAGIWLGLIFATRILNTGFALLYLGFVVMNNCRQHWTHAFTRYSVGLFLLFAGIAIFPQLLYWKYAFGSWLVNSYQGETFTHCLNPYWRTTFLSVNSGLFIQTPLWLLLLLFPISFVKKQPHLAFLLWGILGLQAYLCASWWAPGFGCSFGHRVFVDVLPFAALGMATCIKPTQGLPQKFRSVSGLGIMFVAVIVCTYFTQYSSYRFEGCWTHDYYDYGLFYEKLLASEQS